MNMKSFYKKKDIGYAIRLNKIRKQQQLEQEYSIKKV